MPKIVYQPPGFSIGDAMPFYEKGTFYFYHYKSAAADPSPAQNWTLSSTRDFVKYHDPGELFRHGAEGTVDFIFRSGALLKKDGKYHLFYGGAADKECLLHASGTTIFELEKDPFMLSPAPGYDQGEWRDPFVSWCEELGAYIMLLGARQADGKYHNGCTVWFTSPDIIHWNFRGDFWAPHEFTTHEMPDLFRMGRWWYLLVSEYSDTTQVIYRRSLNINGPWEPASDDALDGAAYFAGRTCFDGKDRYLAGWIAGRNPREDLAPWGGAGGLWIHRIFQRDDDSLAVDIPKTVYPAFKKKRILLQGSTVIQSLVGRKETLLGFTGSDLFMIEALVEASAGTRAFSFNLLENEKTGEAYEYRFFIPDNLILLSKTPNHGITPPDHFRGMEKLYRRVRLFEEKTYHIQLIYDDTYVILYVNGAALSGRVYRSFGTALGAAVFNGEIHIRELSIREGLKEASVCGDDPH
jgi:beta-fructofuranosidase